MESEVLSLGDCVRAALTLLLVLLALRMRRPGKEESEDEPAPAQHPCPHCGRSFGTRQALSAHRRFCKQEESNA